MNTQLIIGTALLFTIGLFTVWYVVDRPIATTPVDNDTATTLLAEHVDELAGFEISPSEAVIKIQSSPKIIVLDVRTLTEYEEIHVQGAVLLPVQEISQKSLQEIGLGIGSKDSEIIIYGRSGSRSKTAYGLLKSLGYTKVSSVAGGMVHWQEDDYPLTESGPYQGKIFGSEAEAVSVGDTPVIYLNTTEENLGVIPQYGGVVTRDFQVDNSGTEVLEIGDITTSCSCTTATISQTSINPGESAVLSVVFDPDFHAEPLDVFKRTVFIPTNDPNTPEAEVSIVVDIAEGE